jgi:hypothetical protein
MWPPHMYSRHVKPYLCTLDMCTLVLGMGLKKQPFEFDDDDDPDHLNLSR